MIGELKLNPPLDEEEGDASLHFRFLKVLTNRFNRFIQMDEEPRGAAVLPGCCHRTTPVQIDL